MKGINLTLAKVTSCDRWLVTSRRFFFYTYLRSTSFCYVCSPWPSSCALHSTCRWLQLPPIAFERRYWNYSKYNFKNLRNYLHISKKNSTFALVLTVRKGKCYDDIDVIPHKTYGLLLGTGRSAAPSPYYEARLQISLAAITSSPFIRFAAAVLFFCKLFLPNICSYLNTILPHSPFTWRSDE